MWTGAGLYNNGASVTTALSTAGFEGSDRTSGSGYYGGVSRSDVDPIQTGMNQKLDRLVTLVLEQKEVSGSIQKETNELKKVVASLTTELSVVKEKLEQPNISPNNTVKRIPSQLSVSAFYIC